MVVSNLHAQQNELPVTTMITSKAVGDTFSLIIEVNDPKGGSVEGLEGTAEEGVYQITSQIIRIYGDLTLLNCARNQLTSLDVSQLTYIIGLYCSQNRLSALDISKLTNLSSLYCFNNLFTTEAIEEIIQDLPDQSYLSDVLRGEFVPMSSQQSDQTIELSVEMLSQLSDKGWDAYDGASDNPIGVVPLILPDEVTISDLTATTHGHKLSNPTQVFIGEGFTIHYSLERAMRRDGQPKYSQVKWLVDGVEQGAGQVFDYEVLPGQHTLTLQVKLNTMGIDRLVAGLSGAWLVEGILYLERGGEDVQATLYDSTGATLLVTSESQIDLSSFAPGVYFVRIVDRLFQVVL